MKQAVIVSTARTPIGKAYRGLFNNTEAPTMAGHAIRAAVARAGVEGAEVDDVIMGCAMPQGTQSLNVGRLSALAAGLPVTVSGMTMDRQCASGLWPWPRRPSRSSTTACVWWWAVASSTSAWCRTST